MLYPYGVGVRDGARLGDVSLTHIQSFVAVAEEGHVGRAARRLHLSQPPLSRHILSLEDELGAPLFERTPRGMRLLPAGEAFLQHARRILAEVDAAVHTVRGVAAERSGGP
ncbi:LysR family transcriptional regulator [Melittangium boletus DSM 14713]|uniref:LysR family transcriptional regulator n=1 Tax=Melittangium boletus DSM 14713 TaxID=1294270 RepID=A0A250IS36_9BACT|nr:LysR family transcriptional regulator [Melittangium boletus DSM 14713]